jgi:hypothetical protein
MAQATFSVLKPPRFMLESNRNNADLLQKIGTESGNT